MSADTDKAKTAVYECVHYEYEYDDLGKYAWCHNRGIPCRECPADTVYAMQFCPGYAQGRRRGRWEITDREKKDAERMKHKFAKKGGAQ